MLDAAVTVTFAGTEGGVESMTTVVVAVLVPFALPALRVKIVVEATLTAMDPEAVLVLKPPGAIMMVLAPVTFHESVEVTVELDTPGFDEKDAIVGETSV